MKTWPDDLYAIHGHHSLDLNVSSATGSMLASSSTLPVHYPVRIWGSKRQHRLTWTLTITPACLCVLCQWCLLQASHFYTIKIILLFI